MKSTIQTNAKTHHSTLIIGVPEHINQLEDIKLNDEIINDKIEQLKRTHIVSSNIGKVSSTHFNLSGNDYKVIAVGLGNLKEATSNQYLNIFGELFQFLKSERITEADILFDTFRSKIFEDVQLAALLGQQSEAAIYQFDGYKTNKSAPYELELDIHSSTASTEALQIALDRGSILANAINLSRDYSNIPPNILTPSYYAQLIENHFKDSDVTVDVKDGDTLQREGFGLIHAVGKGSKHSPRLITLTYNGTSEDQSPVALVGKGITYDSGGYSIKSKTGMQTMKFDMCGSANVVAMIDAVSKLNLKINIVGVIAAAENMINEIAMKPDDVYTALSGETVEVLNTDAEGRLVLGDAVFYATQFQPEVILDFATLTGAAIVALGEDKAAVFNNNASSELSEILSLASQRDEYVFELPMTDTERKLIKKSDVADLVNHTNGQGKALFAATFINHFAGNVPHMHFDIAGPATTNKNSYKGPKGPTAFLVTTIVDWLSNQR
ncbi:leucyl aminopeptidase family protein [Staphylococcus sp. ACRSN]|uniref:M17 family metallopeptidase n=1 Tax=Staphylococcus sp. ACRSN TaxID=2918214 RepID=UPI001EF1ADE2|nr:leucyl aminopeptidase family protein [Staphylococcus sp. ACRSN]MCG7339440.1 leucyl aminopeptidase family protein [Staphylococcus sp. ACRSN]